MYSQTNIIDVENAVKRLGSIERPYGDNEGDALNSQSILNVLDENTKSLVHESVSIIEEYIFKNGIYPDRRAIGVMCNRGIEISDGPSQYDFTKYVCKIQAGEWDIVIITNV